MRPQDVRVEKATSGEQSERLARVERLIRVGSYVKLSVSLPDGNTLSVQMPRHEFEERGIEQGDSVLLDLRQIRLSSRTDYMI